jgi:hypothetical protein
MSSSVFRNNKRSSVRLALFAISSSTLFSCASLRSFSANDREMDKSDSFGAESTGNTNGFADEGGVMRINFFATSFSFSSFSFSATQVTFFAF